MKVKTKSMIVLMIALFAVILLGATTKVNAFSFAEAVVETGEISNDFNIKDTFNLNIDMSEIEKAPILIIEQLANQLSEQGVKIKVVNANESGEKSHIVVFSDSEKTMNIIVYGNNYNIITEKVVNVTYNNSSNYNENDKASIENALKKVNQENGKYLIEEYIELGTNFNIEELTIKELKKLLNDSSITITRGAGGGSGGEPAIFSARGNAEYYIYKNGVHYFSIYVDSSFRTKITVPSNEDLEKYATTRIKEYFADYNNNYSQYFGTISFSKLEKISKDKYKVYWGNGGSDEILIQQTKPTTEPVTKEDTETGVKLETTTGVLPSNVVLSSTIIRSVTLPNITPVVLQFPKSTVYDINLLKDNVKIQPNGKVKISLPIPEDYNKSTLEIYRIDENGEKTKYDVKVEGNYATFETDHFSIYVLADVIKNDTTNNNQGTTNNTQPPKNNNRELDETPKTGTIDTVKYILPVMIISAVGIIALRKKTK